jgi:uncharacterized membrane protein
MNNKNKVNINCTERVLSVALGGVLLRKSVKKFDLFFSLSGLYLVYRGIKGQCSFYRALNIDSNAVRAVNVRSYFTINKPREELYAYWRNLENLPNFLAHLNSVKIHGHNRSTWSAKIPGYPGEITWDTEIVKDEPNQLIGWQSMQNTFLSNAGKVMFKDAPNNQGTEITVIFSYRPPMGTLGAGISKVFNKTFESLLAEEIRGFKQIMEAGERPTNKIVRGN